MAMVLTDPIMEEFVIVMSLFAVAGVTRREDFDCGRKRNVGFTMML